MKKARKNHVSIIRVCLILPLLCTVCAACDKNSGLLTANYPVNDAYTDLEVHDAFEVVVCDTVTEAIVTVRENEHKNVIVKVENGTLKIGFESGLFNWFHGSTNKVLLPRNAQLCDVELHGASSFRGDLQGEEVELDISGASDFYGNILATEVSIDLSGSSDFEGNVDADNIDFEISGSSRASSSGSCSGQMDMSISGSSKLNAYGLQCRAVTGTVSGSSKAYISCCENLTVSVSGSSDLYYRIPSGCSPVVNCSTSGSSGIHAE